MPCDPSQVMRRGHAAAVEVAVELLPVDADLAADLRDGSLFGAQAAQVSAKIGAVSSALRLTAII